MKFKQVLAGLLVGTMVVTSAPVSGLGALSALAASEEAETKNYNYTKLTEGLTASADCANGTNTMNAVLNGNPDDYWHSAWEGDNQPVKQGGEVIMNSNNNITLTLTEASTVKKLEYVSNGAGNNGTITKCNIYYKTSAENAEFKKVQEDPYTLSFTESKATIEFTDAISDVKEIKIEVLNTAGDPNNTFISGKELYVYRDDSTKIDSGNILAKAECSSQGDAALKNLVDNNEATGYHSSWGGNGGTVAADEGFTEIVRPGTMTTPTELISRNNLYINLAGSETIGKIAYLPRQGSGNGVANGRITAANIYISNADVNDVSAITDWKQVATADWENNSDEKNVTFSPETAKHIRIEVKHSAGDQTDAYINAAAIDIYKAEEVVAEDKVISKPVLTAVAPVTGEKPADVTAADPKGYTVATAWTDSDGNTVTEFEDGKDYTLTATLTAAEGYKFTDESKPSTIKVGEEDLEVTAEVKDSGKTMTLSYTFKGAEIGGDSVLSKPEITVTAPVKDAEPKDAQTDGFGYAATSKWTNKDGDSVTKFEAGQDYTLRIALTAEEGNIFDKTSIPEKIQVGEEEVAVNASDVVISGEGKIMTLTLVFSVPADEVQYAKLEGLTGKADSEELEHDGEGEDGAIDNALDGNIETFWHTNWSDDSKAKVTYSDGKLTGNNTYTITLAKASTVTSLTYMPRNHYDGSGNIANGAISECEVYVSTDHGKNWTLAGKAEGETAWNYVKETEDGADQNFVERTVTFDKTYAGVTDVKVKAIKTAGVQANMFINAAEFGVIGKEDTETPEVSEARKALAAEIASVKDLKEADYTEESYADLKNALAKANTLKDKTDVSKAEIEDAIKAISDAKKGLKTKVAAKKEELNSLLTAVYDDLMANGNKYTVASYNNAVTVYKAVKDVPGKDGVTVAELEKAIKDLNDAKDALVLQETADLEKAKENAANTLKDAAAIADAGQKDYEEASWKVFDAAYKALKNAPADADKATLESLTLALRNAQAALKKAETPAVALDAPKVKAAKAKVTKTGVVVNVTVEAVKDAASYDVYRVVKGKATKVGTTAAGKTTVKDKKAVKGASYYAVAVSKDGKAVSKAGAAVAVKLAKAPKIQKATAGSKNAKLSWKKVKGAKVVVYRSTKKNSGYRKVATTRKNATSVTNKKGLKAGKTYYYKIATIKGKLISAMSKAKRVKIKK